MNKLTILLLLLTFLYTNAKEEENSWELLPNSAINTWDIHLKINHQKIHELELQEPTIHCTKLGIPAVIETISKKDKKDANQLVWAEYFIILEPYPFRFKDYLAFLEYESPLAKKKLEKQILTITKSEKIEKIKINGLKKVNFLNENQKTNLSLLYLDNRTICIGTPKELDLISNNIHTKIENLLKKKQAEQKKSHQLLQLEFSPSTLLKQHFAIKADQDNNQKELLVSSLLLTLHRLQSLTINITYENNRSTLEGQAIFFENQSANQCQALLKSLHLIFIKEQKEFTNTSLDWKASGSNLNISTTLDKIALTKVFLSL